MITVDQLYELLVSIQASVKRLENKLLGTVSTPVSGPADVPIPGTHITDPFWPQPPVVHDWRIGWVVYYLGNWFGIHKQLPLAGQIKDGAITNWIKADYPADWPDKTRWIPATYEPVMVEPPEPPPPPPPPPEPPPPPAPEIPVCTDSSVGWLVMFGGGWWGIKKDRSAIAPLENDGSCKWWTQGIPVGFGPESTWVKI